MHNISIKIVKGFGLINVTAVSAKQNHDSPHLASLICQFWINVFFMVLSPKSLTELAGTQLCVSSPHPHSICLLSSLAYSRCSVHVYRIKVLFLSIVELRYWTDSVGFVSHELLYEAIVLMRKWELTCWKDWFSPLGVNMWECVRVDGGTTMWWVWVCA